MKYPRIISAIKSAKWAVRPATLDAIVGTLGAAVRGELKPRGSMLDMMGSEDSEVPKIENVGRWAVIPVCGIIGKRLDSLETECGGCDLDKVGEMLDTALMDPRVEGIVFDFDSPGGTITGVPELAARILSAGKQKMTVAWTETQCCSAAYWLASQCNQVIMSPSADIGSIGVYMALVDSSGAWAMEGYKLELIKAGTFKAAGIAGSSLSDEQRSLWQSEVDAIYAEFTGTVKNCRPKVQDETCQGQCFDGPRALAVGLVDAVDADFLRNLSTTG